MTRICHITSACHATSWGDPARYLLELVRNLDPGAWNSWIGWRTDELNRKPFDLEGVRIVPFYLPESPTPGSTSSLIAAAIRAFFQQDRPDLFHFHTFGRGESIVANLAVQEGIPYAFTYHDPIGTCLRENLLLWGKEPCDGQIRPLRCAACKLQERLGGTPRHAEFAARLAAFSAGPLGFLADARLRRRAALVEQTRRLRHDLNRFLAACDLVLSGCPWSTDLLVANGARADRVRLCPPGVPTDLVQAAACETAPAPTATFTIGYAGPLAPSGGVHILVDAFLAAEYDRARLKLLEWSAAESSTRFVQEVTTVAARDVRIELLPRLPLARKVAAYRNLSLLAVPSFRRETGPLALLEALHLGVPVWSSNRAGPLDLVRQHGRVVEPNTRSAWQNALAEAYALHRQGLWRTGAATGSAAPDRTMKTVADEVAAAYGSLASHE